MVEVPAPRSLDVVLAHYGGVPEGLTIALPLLIFTGFMLLERRARRRERERSGGSAEQREAARQDGAAPPRETGPDGAA